MSEVVAEAPREIARLADPDDGGPLLAAIDLRDYFAAKAMHALVVEPPWGDGGTATVHSWSKGFKGSDSCDRFAFAAYAMADAMLEARSMVRRPEPRNQGGAS